MLAVFALDNLLEAGSADGEPDEAARTLLERREAARAARDFAEADRLRDELNALGWAVRDSPTGPELVRAER
jgi:cysteinyl-tRNA synthetase